MRLEKFTIGQAHINKLLVGELNGKMGTEARLSSMLKRYTYEDFASCPVTAKKGGGAVAGATGEEDLMIFEENIFEYHILGAGQTLLAPVFKAGGLDIGLDQAADEGCEVSQGILSRSRAAFTVGTDAFYAKCKFSIETVAGTDDCAFGFRKAEDYQANIDDYDEMAALNVIAGDIKIETILNNAATDTTDTTDAWADGETHTLEVYVDLLGQVTFKIDGAAPTVTASFTFDSGEAVVPFLYMLNHTGGAGAVLLKEWECGLLM